MPVETFVDDPEPDDASAEIWRYVDLWKLKDLLDTGQLYLRRADKLDDEQEGLPPSAYEKVLRLSKYDLNDILERDHYIGQMAQFRQGFYVNCWHLQVEETAAMWARYGHDGVALISRYDLLKRALDPLPDKVLVGLVRYGTAHLTGWNVIRFVTTKREEYRNEREVRAMIWITDPNDGVNRHFDLDNRPHDRPIYDPPDSLPEGIRRKIDMGNLIKKVVVNPKAPQGRLEEVRDLLDAAGLECPIRDSALKRFASMIPTGDELKRLGG